MDNNDPVKQYLISIGRKGGSKRSPAKTLANRENAKKALAARLKRKAK